MFNPKALIREMVRSIPGVETALLYGYYVAPATLDNLIARDGIPVSEDGKIHLFGRRSCALALKEREEATGKALFTVWRADISGLKAYIDPVGEEISQECRSPVEVDTTRGDENQFCHGYTIAQSIGPDRLSGTINYCSG